MRTQIKNSGVEIADPAQSINFGAGLTAVNEYGEVTVSFGGDDLPLSFSNSTDTNTISVDQNGNTGTDVSTDGAVHIENTGNTGIGLGVYTNIGATAEAPLVSLRSDNSGFDQEVLYIRNDGVSNGIYIQQQGVLGSSKHAIDLRINSDMSASGTSGMRIYSNVAHTGSGTNGALLRVLNDNASATNLAAVIQQDGANTALQITSNGDRAHINLTGDPTVGSPDDGDLWFDGTNLKLQVGASTFNVDVTAA